MLVVRDLEGELSIAGEARRRLRPWFGFNGRKVREEVRGGNE